MKGCAVCFLAVFLTSLMSGLAQAQDSLNIRMLGEVHPFVEQSYNIAMSGEYAFVSSGLASGLRVLDLSNPASPVEVGYAINSDPHPDVLMWMADIVRVSGTYAYVLYFDGTWSFTNFRLYVYDLSNPGAPRQAGYMPLPDNCTDLCVDGAYAYITTFDFDFAGVVIIDVSDPMQPVEIGSFQTQGMPQGICVAEGIAFIADNDALVVCDVSDPTSPTELGRYTPEGGMSLIHHVAVQGDYVCILDASLGFRVLDTSDLPRIEEVGSFPHDQTDAYFSPLEISEDLAYYLQNGDISGKELIILDVSEPTAPVKIGSHALTGSWWFYGFDYCEGYACIAGGKNGLRVIDVSDPQAIVEIGFYDSYDLTSGLAVSGDHAFVGTYMNDLVVFDVSNPSSPVEVTSLDFDDSPIKRISVWGNHLYVPGVIKNLYGGVSVLDISNPTVPEEIAYWSAPEGYSGLPFNVERYEDYAFVACALGGVEIYEVSRIDQPVPLGKWTLWDPATNPDFGVTNVKLSWPYLFAPDRALGLYVLDVSDPSHIEGVATCPTPGEAMWLDISPDHQHVYIADFDGGLRIIDVSNPLTPVEVGFYDENLHRATHVAVCGDSVYVTDGGEIGLRVFNVSDPTTPTEVAYHKTPGAYAHDVAVVNGLIYALDFTHFEIFQIGQGPSPETDSDGDGIIDSEDNCPYAYNPDQAPVDRGDVNCEDGINILDVLSVVNHILNTVPLIGAPLDRADCNGDGEIDVRDVIGMANVILGTIPECPGNESGIEINLEVMEFFTLLQPHLSVEEFDRFMVLVKAEVRIPSECHLSQNYPNPFNSTTDIRYQISDRRYPVSTTLKIYNILGQEVRTLVDEVRQSGDHVVTWDGKDNQGVDVPSGVYLYRITAGEFVSTKKMILMK